jgi:hypothetical protein
MARASNKLLCLSGSHSHGKDQCQSACSRRKAGTQQWFSTPNVDYEENLFCLSPSRTCFFKPLVICATDCPCCSLSIGIAIVGSTSVNYACANVNTFPTISHSQLHVHNAISSTSVTSQSAQHLVSQFSQSSWSISSRVL